MQYANGSKYVGDWIEDQKEGQGNVLGEKNRSDAV